MFGVAQAIHGGDHTGGIEKAAVMEFDAGAQGKGPGRAVGIGCPGQRQAWAENEVRAVEDEEFAGLAEHGKAADFGDGDRVDGAGGDLAGDADGRTWSTKRCRSPRRQCGQHTDSPRMVEELPAGDLATAILL